MFLFSKKFLSVLLVTALIFVGEDNSAKGAITNCWECNGNGDDLFAPQCDDKHDGGGTGCFSPHSACSMQVVDNKITKACEGNASIWSDNGKQDGNPKCDKNKECYCNNADFCNKDKTFGLENGSFGTKDMFPARSIIFWMLTTVAVTLAPLICILKK